MLFWLLWSFCTLLFLLPASGLPAINIWDKAMHAGVFALLMILALPAYKKNRAAEEIAMLLIAYGLAIEVVQHFIPTRSFSLLDVLADAIGVSCILIGAYFIKQKKSKKRIRP